MDTSRDAELKLEELLELFDCVIEIQNSEYGKYVCKHGFVTNNIEDALIISILIAKDLACLYNSRAIDGERYIVKPI